ncbi:hypothetical protein T440DRAFT_494065 [Plenodomus tracheiphilus IPT5]|uniref:Uncharacterized protein n=1 Tax=Plenodomus tracheiphilus IPT5 TaxID=1408161 RepID=A0A6A7AQ65_9PLEO|nr:hypothetical protein T440DRAFT_494065 [Plenodomus tracheiphilus IPT5]
MILHRWIGVLKLAQQSPPSWYRSRLREELQERRIANPGWQRLSESSDVFHNSLAYACMVAKYTSRWMFHRTAARFCGSADHHMVCEVINPAKDHKLEEVALRHVINPLLFGKTCCRLRRVWPLLP